MKLRWLYDALLELEHSFVLIATKDHYAAHRMARLINHALLALETFQQAGRAGRVPRTLELPVAGAPCVIVYAVGDDHVTILSVLFTQLDTTNSTIQ